MPYIVEWINNFEQVCQKKYYVKINEVFTQNLAQKIVKKCKLLGNESTECAKLINIFLSENIAICNRQGGAIHLVPLGEISQLADDRPKNI